MVEGRSEPHGEGGDGRGCTERELVNMLVCASSHYYTPSEMKYTRSAKESSSCPISDDLLRHRATLPSMKSKNKPKGMYASAIQRLPKSLGLPRQ